MMRLNELILFQQPELAQYNQVSQRGTDQLRQIQIYY
jgi:hypothetical protein